MLTGFLLSSAAASIYSFKTAIRHRVSPNCIGPRNCVPMAFTAESPPAQGQYTLTSKRVLPWQVTMDQLIRAALSYTHYWYQVSSGCVCCVFFPFILDIKVVGRAGQGHKGGRSHRISHPPSFCGARLNFYREKDSAIPFPRRP